MNALNFLKEHKWIIVILILGAFLRFYNLDFQSPWLDEIFTMSVSDPALTWEEFKFEMLLREGFPYLYFFILKAFYAIFGYSVMTARAVSVLGGLAGILSVYAFTKEVYNKKAALFAALLLAFNEYNIYISQDARPYSLYFFAAVLTFWRLAILLKNPTLRNGIIYGLFAALLLNLNFFSFVNLLSQCVIVAFFFLIGNRERRLALVKSTVPAGLIAIALFLPNYKLLDKLLSWKSFWVLPPQPDSFAVLFREFLGNSEMTMFVIAPLFVYFLIHIFRRRDTLDDAFILADKLQFTFVMLFGWVFVFTIFIMVKSYLDISLMLARYFTSITPVFFIVLGISIDLVRNRLAKILITTTLVAFMLVNLLAVKQYYWRVTKTQFRELTADLIVNNPQKDKVVSSWGYLFNHFIKDHMGRNTTEMTLENYVRDLMAERIDNNSFWYTDANSRPYQLAPELETWLNEHFVMDQSIEYHDIWARHYKSRHAQSGNRFLTLTQFQPSAFDGSGAMIFVQNSTSEHPAIELPAGSYLVLVKGTSLPNPPIKGENAHFTILANGKELGGFQLGHLPDNPGGSVNYEHSGGAVRIALRYDNDAVEGTLDRNAIIQSVQIKAR